MGIFWCILIILAIIYFVTYNYFKMTIDEILNKLVVLDKIFESRYNDLSKAIYQFQKYLPDQKDLIIDIQRAKADAAKYSKPKTTEELAQKILNENALTINLNFLIDKCDFQKIHPDLKDCLIVQVEYIRKIEETATEYNKLLKTYKQIKDFFPFNLYSKMKEINLELDEIRTEL